MALSNNVFAATTFVAMLLSIPVLGAGIWLVNEPDNSCVHILEWPVIILGTLVLVVGVVGFVGGFWRMPLPLMLYFVGMLILIILLGCLAFFVHMVTIRGSGRVAPNRAYLEYHLNDFAFWLRRRVTSSYRWGPIRSCLSSKSMCDQLDQNYRTAQDFFNARLSPLQSGCCKPPTWCEYQFINPTYWISPSNTSADMDCLRWSNDQMQLCYNCDSCKAGLLANIKEEWRKADIVLIITLVALIFVYLIGFCAFKSSKTENLFRRYKEGTYT